MVLPMLSLTSHAEMLAVLRALVEAKFHGETEDYDVPGSAILAEVAIRVRDAVIAEEVRRDGVAAEHRWRDWVRLDESRAEWVGARRYALSEWTNVWARWSDAERLAAAAALLSPFEPGQEGLRRFLAEVAAGLGGGA